MKINKIPKGPLRTITHEVISSAKSQKIKLDGIYADWWERDRNIGSVHFEAEERLIRINYFNRERDVQFCDIKKGDSKLTDTIYERISVNTSLMPTYSTTGIL